MPYQTNRKMMRYQQYDYAQVGFYHVTICTHHRLSLFGEICDGVIKLNIAGQLVAAIWQTLPIHFVHIQMDEFQVLPDHIHGIIEITTTSITDKADCGVQPQSLSAIVQNFKSVSARRMRGQNPAMPYPCWQRNYYDTIIRNDQQLANTRQYIRNNIEHHAFT